LGEEFEGAESQQASIGIELCLTEQLADLLPATAVDVLVLGMVVIMPLAVIGIMRVVMTVMMAIFGLVFLFCDFSACPIEHVNLRCTDAAAIDGRESERGSDVQGLRGLFQQRARDARIDQRAEHHVSADAGETFKITDTHVLFSKGLRQHVDGQDLIHGAGAIAITIDGNIVEACGVHGLAYLFEDCRRQC
jgi:hypothetical protein